MCRAALSTLYRLMEVLSVATVSPGCAPIKAPILSPRRWGRVNHPASFQERMRPWPHSAVTARATRSGALRGITPSELPSR